MVFFSCEACNETCKKNQVENHIYRCHAPFSCVDCGKVFPGDSYKQHTSCISEAEKYEKSVYKGPKGGKKKRNPQEVWMDMIHAVAAEASGPKASAMPPLLRKILPRMADMANVPRNEKKFKNYVKNSFKIHNEKEHEQLWQFLENRRKEAQAKEDDQSGKLAGEGGDGSSQKEADTEEKQDKAPVEAEKTLKKRKREAGDEDGHAEAATSTSGGEEAGGKKQKKKDKKKGPRVEEAPGRESGQDATGGEQHDEPQNDSREEEDASNKAEKMDVIAGAASSFAWEKEMKRLVKKADNRHMPLKALQKAVLALAQAYEETAGASETTSKKILKKVFKAKVASIADLSIEDGVVTYKKATKQGEAP